LIERLRGPPVDRIRELVRKLEDDEWEVREDATAALTAMGPGVASALRQALTEGELGAEAGERVKTILDGFSARPAGDGGDDDLRALRGVLVFDWLGTPEVVTALERLAAGGPSPLQRDAAAALAWRRERQER
jgi:hypothetical protein